MRVRILFVFFILISFNSFAHITPVQDLVDRTKETSQFEPIKLITKNVNFQELEGTEKHLKKGQVVTLNFSVLNTLYQKQPDAITLDLPIDQNKTITLELLRVNILGTTFNVKTDKEESQNYKAGAYYRGVVKDMPNSVAAISFFEKKIIGVISTPKHGNLNFGKIKNKTEHIIYAEADLINPPKSTCGVTELEDGHYDLENDYTNYAERVASNKVLGVYLECDHDLYEAQGNTVDGVLDYITGLYNIVATLYANEDINTVISQVFVWTSPDSYATANPVAALNSFETTRPFFEGDIAHLISAGAPILTGYANLSSNLCSENYAYSFVEETYEQLPIYSNSVQVVTHEIGHNLGSPHTQDCVWNGNNTAIDGCASAAGYPGSPAPCAAGPIPNGGGTIMSYCNLTRDLNGDPTNNPGINFSNGFGQQPGDLIRSRVNTSCIGDFIGEVGKVTRSQSNGTTFYTVNLRHDYNDPVVIMGPISYNGAHPSNVRVRNITSNSFEYQVDEWDYLDGGHTSETISYLVVESGTHELPNSIKLVAGKTNNVNHDWQTITFPSNFVGNPGPVVFSQISTYNGSQAANTRQRTVTNNNFQVRVQEEEGNDDIHANETVSWVAITQGQSLGSFSASKTGNSVTHAWSTINFNDYTHNPVFLAKPQTYDGPDPMALRYRNLTNSNVQIFCEEEASRDTEVAHTTEVVGYLVLNGQKDLVSNGTYNTAPILFKNEAASAIKKAVSPLTIYPNPVFDILQIDYKELDQQQPYSIQIIDMVGHVVLISDNLDNIDVSHLETGMYLLRLNTENSTAIHQKFIKM